MFHDTWGMGSLCLVLELFYSIFWFLTMSNVLKDKVFFSFGLQKQYIFIIQKLTRIEHVEENSTSQRYRF